MFSFSRISLFSCVCFFAVSYVYVSDCSGVLVKPAVPAPTGPTDFSGPHDKKHVCRGPTGSAISCCCFSTYECATQAKSVNSVANDLIEFVSYDYQELVDLGTCLDTHPHYLGDSLSVNGAGLVESRDYVFNNITYSLPWSDSCSSDTALNTALARFVYCQDNVVGGPITSAYATNARLSALLFSSCWITVRNLGPDYNVCATFNQNTNCVPDVPSSPPINQTLLDSFISTGGVNECLAPTLPPVPSANGDPSFTGFLGQLYQVHGLADMVYNIISSPNLVFNALFTFLDSGVCRRGTPCFSHPGNYFGSVGLLVRDPLSKSVYSVEIHSGPAAIGLTVVVIDRNQPTVLVPVAVGVGSSIPLASGSQLVFVSPFEVRLEGGDFNIRFQNSDHFLNQDISIGTDMASTIQQYKVGQKRANLGLFENSTPTTTSLLPHGILGQTWNNQVYANRWKHIEGQLDEYLVADGLIGTRHKYNKFASN